MKTLNIEEAADFLGIHRDTLRQRAAAGMVPAYKPGRRWMFLEDELLEYLKTTTPVETKIAVSASVIRSRPTTKELDARLKIRTSARPTIEQINDRLDKLLND